MRIPFSVTIVKYFDMFMQFHIRHLEDISLKKLIRDDSG